MASSSSDKDDQSGRDADISKRVFEIQLLEHVHLLQRYRCSEDRNTTCSLQKEALQALYRIYSLRLRPANYSETSSERQLQTQLLELINQPYGIQNDSGKPHAVLVIEGPESPLWDLHDWSLKLTRLLIDNGHLSANTAGTVETNLIRLLETIHKWQLKEPVRPRTSKNIAIIAHCLCKIFKINGPTESTQRQLMSPSLIQNHLFPLACEFAAREYPASIMDPISYYELFDSSGKLVEPDEALVEWNRRNERVDAPGNGSKRIRLDDECSDLKDDHLDPLPPAHACLEHLIYKLTVSSNRKDQDVIVMFLQRKVFEPRDKPNGDTVDGSGTSADDGLRKLALMNKIVALHVLGRVKLQPISSDEISFVRMLVLPNLEQDCLLLKLCKFQLVRFIRMDDIKQQLKLAKAFLGEFMKILKIEDYQDPCNKLFVIFASVASEFLHRLWCFDRQVRSQIDIHLTPLDRISQLILVKKITDLYLYYKIVAPLALVEIIYLNDVSGDFWNNVDRLLTKVIDSIAAELLVISHASDRAQNLLKQLDIATRLRGLLLPETTVDKLIRLAKMRMLSNDHGLPLGDHLDTSSYLERTIRNPLQGQTRFLAIDMMHRFFDDRGVICNLNYATMILGNLCYHQVISSTMESISNNSSATTTSTMHDQYGNRNPLFESHERLRYILALCERIQQKISLSSSWVISILMSWPSFLTAAEVERPSKLSSIKLMWDHFVDFTITIWGKLTIIDHSHKILFTSLRDFKDDDFLRYITRVNFLFALIAAFNHDPKRLENYLNYVIGPVGRSRSHILKYVKLWLDVIIRTGDNFIYPESGDNTFAYRSYMVISHQALINIHKAQTAGNKLGFSIKGLKSKLNSARRFVLKWLADIRQQAIKKESPLENFYAHYIRQLEAIGDYK